MDVHEDKAQILVLSPNEDGKKWVAEIVDEDPVFRLKRVFLPEIKEGTYEIFDGIYQIQGIFPGISPFNKEYCIVKNGHMTRHIPVQMIYQKIPEIKEMEIQRKNRIKKQIKQLFSEIQSEINDERVNEEIMYQMESLDDIETSEQLMAGFSQLIKNKDNIIKKYKQRL